MNEIDPEDYSAALDEIYRLRQALAYEADVVTAQTDLKLSKRRRSEIDASVERLRAAARGEAQRVYAGTSSLSLRGSLKRAGAPDTLTRWQWEATVPKRPEVV
jgi:collagenase-like PrtC family protease